jgi:hypothetical protein
METGAAMSENGNGNDNGNGAEPNFEKFLNLKRVRMVDVDRPTGQMIELPHGKEIPIRLFEAPQYQLWVALQKGEEPAERQAELVEYATSDENDKPLLDDVEHSILSPVMRSYIIHAAARQGALMLFVLRKNAQRPEPQKSSALADRSQRQPSKRPTKSSTSLRGSRKGSPKISGP